MTASEKRGTWNDVRSLGVLGRAWALGIVAFSIGRALIAWPTLGRYGVDPWTFLALDIVTALPYGLGQAITVKILGDRSRPPRQALPWAVVVAAAFMAPYVYIFWASGSMPGLAYAGVLAWMVVFGVLSVIRIGRQVRLVGAEGMVAPSGPASESGTKAAVDADGVDGVESPDSRSTT